MRQLAAGAIGWGGAVGLAAVFADVDPWRCGVALLLAALALAPGVGLVLRVALAAIASVPLLDAGQHMHGVWWLLALASVSAIGPSFRPRVGVAAGFGAMAVLAAAAGVSAPVLAFAALVALGTPAARWSGSAVLVAGAIALVQSVTLSWQVASEPLAEAARRVQERRALRLEPVLAVRAAAALGQGDLDGARAVVRAAPGSVATGQAIARLWGVDVALDAGWAPEGPVDPDVALPLAWALHDAGREREASRILEQQAGALAAVHFAAMRAEQTGAPHLPTGRVPDGAVAAPGRIAVERTLTAGDDGQAIVVAPEGVRALDVGVASWGGAGAAELALRVGGRWWGPLPIEEGRWTLDVALPPGAWRVAWSLDPVGASSHEASATDLTIAAR